MSAFTLSPARSLAMNGYGQHAAALRGPEAYQSIAIMHLSSMPLLAQPFDILQELFERAIFIRLHHEQHSYARRGVSSTMESEHSTITRTTCASYIGKTLGLQPTRDHTPLHGSKLANEECKVVHATKGFLCFVRFTPSYDISTVSWRRLTRFTQGVAIHTETERMALQEI